MLQLQQDNRGIMNKFLCSAIFGILFIFTFLLAGIITESKAVKVVGVNVPIENITDFYYTESSSANPPKFQRYHFYVKDGKHMFYHEKREGNHWPLTETDISDSGSMELSENEWATFINFVKGGKVRKRKENIETGGSGPWLYLYWKGDRSKYQEFSFVSGSIENSFEIFCSTLKDSR